MTHYDCLRIEEASLGRKVKPLHFHVCYVGDREIATLVVDASHDGAENYIRVAVFVNGACIASSVASGPYYPITAKG